MNRRDLIRQAVLVATMAANSALSEVAAGVHGGESGGYTDVVSAVRAGSVATLYLAAFLFVVALWCGRPTMITELPPLTMHTIWAHVYGLGLLVFVSVYCLLGISSCCTCAYIIAIAGVGMDDIIIRHRDALAKRAALLFCTVFAAAAVIVATAESPDWNEFADTVDAGNWFVIACGAVLPLASPFIYTLVRGPRHYTPGMVVEFIYFAAPFAVILSVVVLCTLSVLPQQPPAAAQEPAPQPPEPLFVTQLEANWSHAHSANRSVETAVVERILLVTAADVAMPLLPLTMYPILFLTVKSVFLYSTVDFLAAASVVAAAKHMCHNHAGAGAASPAWPLVLAAAAFACRIYALVDDGNRDGRELYKEETEKLTPPIAEEDKDFDVAEV
jgi:hypothetical protein